MPKGVNLRRNVQIHDVLLYSDVNSLKCLFSPFIQHTMFVRIYLPAMTVLTQMYVYSDVVDDDLILCGRG